MSNTKNSDKKTYTPEQLEYKKAIQMKEKGAVRNKRIRAAASNLTEKQRREVKRDVFKTSQ